MSLPFRWHPGKGLDIPLKVTPKSKTEGLMAYKEGDTALHIKVHAPPEDGKANGAIISVLADVLGLSKSYFTLVKGHTSRQKTVRVALSDPQEALITLAKAVDYPGTFQAV